jgi:2-keto-3-deoxy-L-rhamnonate aldolase RhmA
VPAIDVLMAARQLAPHTVVAVQVEDGADVQRLLHAGAAAVFTPRAAPPEVADELARLITA